MASSLCFFFFFLPVLLLAPSPTWAGSHRQQLCNSWRFNVEVNNLRGWSVVPGKCEDYVAAYMLGFGYRDDSEGAIQQAIDYAKAYNKTSDGSKDIWVFDIDETSLSNVPYYAHHGFGTEAYNDTLFQAWVEEALAPPLPASHKLFNQLKELGFTVFFLTGRDESQRSVTVKNLHKAGYKGWKGLILRQSEDHGVGASLYKSGKRKALEDQGYTIVGNIGDQWSDLTGYSVGSRVFKLPNPMYYIA